MKIPFPVFQDVVTTTILKVIISSYEDIIMITIEVRTLWNRDPYYCYDVLPRVSSSRA
jgi:hypothetical protein